MSRPWIYCLVACLLSVSPAALGQVNTERMRTFDAEGFKTTLGTNLSLQSGNVDLFEIGVTPRVDYRQAQHYAFFAGEFRYGTKGDQPFRDRTFGHLRYNYHVLPWLVGETFTQVQRDGFARLQLRALAGGGLRVQYLDTKTIKIFQGTTPMYEYENLAGSSVRGHPVEASTVRWSNYLNVRLRFTDNTHLITTAYVQPRFDAFDDVRVLHQATLVVSITEHVRLMAEYNLNYDSRPPANVEDLNLSLSNGLQVSF